MSRTQDRLYSDLFHLGGWTIYNSSQLVASSTNLIYTRNAQFDWSLNRTAAGAETYQVILAVANVRRLIETYQFQEQFGGSGAGPQGVPGRPPFTGASQLVPPTAAPAKGLLLTDIVLVHQVGVVGLTSATITHGTMQYANAAANVATVIPTTGAVPLVVQATPYVTTFPVTTPAAVTADLTELMIEAQFVMANTGTLRVYAIGFHCQFNYN